jgi:transposase
MVYYEAATRSQIITLKALGFSNNDIAKKLQIPLDRTTIYRIWTRALDRGFDPKVPIVLDTHVEDAPKSSRPTKQTEEKKAEVKEIIVGDRYAREKTVVVIAKEVGVSKATVLRIMKRLRFKKTKPTRKLGLIKAIKEARLNWCKAHVDLLVEFWYNIIWTDKTSVILGHRRGGYRIWRRPWERVIKSVIRPR